MTDQLKTDAAHDGQLGTCDRSDYPHRRNQVGTCVNWQPVAEPPSATAAKCQPTPPTATFGFTEALALADTVLATYKAEQYAWWKRMDGTPMLNDIAVRMATAFLVPITFRDKVHLAEVGQFLNEMYATMIDPVEQPKMKVTEMCELLLKTAREEREKMYQLSSSPSAAPAPAEPVQPEPVTVHITETVCHRQGGVN